MKSITLQINDKCSPLRRGELYREPLDIFLNEKGLGDTEGGGTQVQDNGEVCYCDLEIKLNDDTISVIEALTEEIERIGVPVGSRLIVDGNNIQVGNLEGVGVYFRYTEAPESLFEEIDMDDFWDKIEEKVAPNGKFHDLWQGEELCAFYYFGVNGEKMFTAIKEELKGHPFEPFIDVQYLPKIIAT